MAILTNDFQTYQNVGIREDLSDVIYRVAPEETPFINNIGSASASSTFHEWQNESLASLNLSNASIEGDTITADAANVPIRVGNRTQISKKTASVSGTNDAVNKAGRGTEMARQIMLKGMELARDQEGIMLQNQASAAGATATARTLGGMESWLTSNTSRGVGGSSGGFSGGTVAAPTDGTQRAFTETLLKAAQLSAFNNGARPTQLYMGGAQKQVFSGFAGIAVNRIDNSPTTGQLTINGAAEIYQGDFGRLTAIPHPYGMRNRTVLGIDPNRVRVATLRPMNNYQLGKQADSNERGMLVEYTLQCDNEKAHFVIADLT